MTMNKERSQQFMQKVVGDVGTAMAAALVLTGDKAGLFKAMGPVSRAARMPGPAILNAPHRFRHPPAHHPKRSRLRVVPPLSP